MAGRFAVSGLLAKGLRGVPVLAIFYAPSGPFRFSAVGGPSLPLNSRALIRLTINDLA